MALVGLQRSRLLNVVAYVPVNEWFTEHSCYLEFKEMILQRLCTSIVSMLILKTLAFSVQSCYIDLDRCLFYCKVLTRRMESCVKYCIPHWKVLSYWSRQDFPDYAGPRGRDVY